MILASGCLQVQVQQQWQVYGFSFLLVRWMPSCLYDFLFVFLFLFWYQQHYSSALRIPSGTSTEMAILWNYLRSLSHYMLRVDWGRWRRETLTYWEMSKVKFRRKTSKISMQNSTSLLLTIISVSFIFLFALNTSNHCLCLLNTAQPGESRAHASGESASGESQASKEQLEVSEGQVLELEQKKEKKFTWLQKSMRKFRRRQRGWWGPNLLESEITVIFWSIRIFCNLFYCRTLRKTQPWPWWNPSTSAADWPGTHSIFFDDLLEVCTNHRNFCRKEAGGKRQERSPDTSNTYTRSSCISPVRCRPACSVGNRYKAENVSGVLQVSARWHV